MKLLSALTLLSLPLSLFGACANNTWTAADSTNNWGDAGNWGPNMSGCYPGSGGVGNGDTANFTTSTSTTPPNTVQLTDTGMLAIFPSLLNLNFTLPGGIQYSIVQSGLALSSFIQFDASAPAEINVGSAGAGGTAVINAPIELNGTSTLSIHVFPGAILQINSADALNSSITDNDMSNINYTGDANSQFSLTDTTIEINGALSFNGAGTTNYGVQMQATTLSAVGGLTVTSGSTVNIFNEFAFMSCGSPCTALFLSPPTIVVDAGAILTTTNSADLSNSLNKSAGISIGENNAFITSATISNGATWKNINTGNISGMGGETNYGSYTEITDVTVETGGSYIHTNSGSITNGVGCQSIIIDLTLESGGTLALANLVGSSIGTTGAGVLIEIGTNMTPGSLTINDGTLIMSNQGTLAGGNTGVGISFVDGGTLTLNGGYAGTFNTGTPSAPLSDIFGAAIIAPAIQINGGGILENNDSVIVQGMAGFGTVTNDGGTIGGTGTFFANVVNNGILSPGTINTLTAPDTLVPTAVPGTLTMFAGDFTQTSTGNFVVNLLNPTTFSVLNVTEFMGMGGTATLAGTITIQAPAGYSLAQGDSFIVLTAATEGATFKFDTINNLLPPGFTPIVTYNPDPSVVITLGTNMGSTVPTHPGGGLLGAIISSVNQYNQMDRLMRLACPVEKKTCETKWKKSSKKAASETKARDCEPHPWNFYVGPLGTVDGEFHTKKGQTGFNYWGAGVLAGGDYVWTHFGMGMVFAFQRFDGHVHHSWGKFKINEFHGSIYAKYAIPALPELAVRGIVGGSYETYRIKRNIDFPTFDINEKAKSKPHGSEFDSLLGIEYTAKVGQGKLIPLIQAQYIYAAINKYREHEAGIFDLEYHSQYIKSLRGNLGLKANYTWTWDTFSFTPEANLMWQREFAAKGYRLYVTSAPFDEPSTFLNMPGFGRNVFMGGIDLLATWNDRYSLEGRYNFEWNSLFHDHFLYLGFDVRF